jgi:hypothetical protein
MVLKSACKEFSGYCPHLDGDNRIRAEYTEVPMCGTLTTNYKCTGFECIYGSSGECKFNRECPLYKIAIVFKP